MGKVRQPSDHSKCGPNHKYLGHFREAKNLNRGHNDTSEDDERRAEFNRMQSFLETPVPEADEREEDLSKMPKALRPEYLEAMRERDPKKRREKFDQFGRKFEKAIGPK